MPASDLLDLAARCEAAVGPDRELEHAIEHAIKGPVRPPLRRGYCPAYTASLDAALLLVLEGLYPGVGQHGPDKWCCNVTKLNRWSVESWAATAALAICAASLRARARAAS